jgi:hypothetical protein
VQRADSRQDPFGSGSPAAGAVDSAHAAGGYSRWILCTKVVQLRCRVVLSRRALAAARRALLPGCLLTSTAWVCQTTVLHSLSTPVCNPPSHPSDLDSRRCHRPQTMGAAQGFHQHSETWLRAPPLSPTSAHKQMCQARQCRLRNRRSHRLPCMQTSRSCKARAPSNSVTLHKQQMMRHDVTAGTGSIAASSALGRRTANTQWLALRSHNKKCQCSTGAASAPETRLAGMLYRQSSLRCHCQRCHVALRTHEALACRHVWLELAAACAAASPPCGKERLSS